MHNRPACAQGAATPQRSPDQQLPCNPGCFERGRRDRFTVVLPDAPILRLLLWHDGSGHASAWFLEHAALQPVSSARHPQRVFFLCFQWLQVRLIKAPFSGTLARPFRTQQFLDVYTLPLRISRCLWYLTNCTVEICWR
jgi:hypothetical protein